MPRAGAVGTRGRSQGWGRSRGAVPEPGRSRSRGGVGAGAGQTRSVYCGAPMPRPPQRALGPDRPSSVSSRRRRKGPRPPAAAPPPKPQPAPRGALGWRWLLLVWAAAWGIRALVAHQLGQTALYQWPQLDAAEFLEWARRIAHGDFSIAPYPTHGPLYPLVLGALLRLTGESLAAVRLIQAVLGAAACAIVAGAAARLFGRGAGIACGLLLAGYGPLVLVDTQLWEEAILLPLLPVLLSLLVLERPPLWAAAAMGATLRLAAVAPPPALVLLPLVLYRLWRAPPAG